MSFIVGVLVGVVATLLVLKRKWFLNWLADQIDE